MFRLLLSIALLVVAGYTATGIYEVKPEETGIAYLFGRVVDSQVPAGIHWNYPPPIGRQVLMPTRLNQVMKVGYGTEAVPSGNLSIRKEFWFTGGSSVVESQLNIQYRIAALDQYILSHSDPDGFMRLAAERAATRFFAGLPVDEILTTSRQSLVNDVAAALQEALDEHQLGIEVQDVSIEHLAPPASGGVFDAFRKVQSARSERDGDIEKAKSEASRVVFDARAQAQRIESRSQADQFVRVERARAESGRFSALSTEHRRAPELTEERIYRDILSSVLQRADLYIVPNGAEKVTIE